MRIQVYVERRLGRPVQFSSIWGSEKNTPTYMHSWARSIYRELVPIFGGWGYNFFVDQEEEGGNWKIRLGVGRGKFFKKVLQK